MMCYHIYSSNFLDEQESLAPTHVSPSIYPSVHMSVCRSHLRISILLASLVALHEKLKKADPNNFSILGLGRTS